MIELGRAHVLLIELGFSPSAIKSDHLERNSTLAISRAISSLLALWDRVLKVGVAGSMVVWCFVTTVWSRGFAKSPTEVMLVGKPIVEYFSRDG